MMKRLSTAAIGFAFACSIGSAQASPYFGFNGRHYGEWRTRRTSAGQRQLSTESSIMQMHRVSASSQKSARCWKRSRTCSGRWEVIRPAGRARPSLAAGAPRATRSGNAVDFEAGGRKASIITWLVANHHTGGTMTYSDMSHIHVDVGPYFVALAAPSGGGGTRTASRRHPRRRYAADYGRDYAGSSRRYAAETSSAMREYAYGYGRGESGSQYSNGYAAIYR